MDARQVPQVPELESLCPTSDPPRTVPARSCARFSLVALCLVGVFLGLYVGGVFEYLGLDLDLEGIFSPEPETELTFLDFPLYSWRLDSAEPLLVKLGKPIFDKKEVDVAKVPLASLSSWEVYSSSYESFGQQFASQLVASGSKKTVGMGFSVEASVGMDSMRTSEYQQFHANVMQIASIYKLTSLTVPGKLHQHLRPDVRDALLTMEVEDIAHSFGEFYVTEVDVGGIFKQSVAVTQFQEDSELELKLAIKASIDSLAYDASAQINTSFRAETSVGGHETMASTYVTGGKTEVWLKLHEGNLQQVREEWAGSIDDTNLVPSNVRVLPIWTLLQHEEMDPEKGNKLQAYLEGKWQSERAKLPSYDKAPSFTFAQIKSAHWLSGCLDGTGNKIRMRKCDSGRKQQHFTVPPTGKPGPIRYRHVDGRCVDVDRKSRDLVLRKCNDGVSQQFTMEAGSIRWSGRRGQCADIKGAAGKKLYSGTRVIVWDCHHEHNQMFLSSPVRAGGQ